MHLHTRPTVDDQGEQDRARFPSRVSGQPAARPARPSHVKAAYLIGVVWLAAGAAACGTQADMPAGAPADASGTAPPARTVTASPASTVTAPGRPSVSPSPTLTGPATLTTADNAATVRLRPGQRVTVALASRGLFSWHVPAAAGTAVKRVSASGGYPDPRPARAAFLAIEPGSATLTAIDDTACLHARPACEPAQQVWRVTVIVTGGSPAP